MLSLSEENQSGVIEAFNSTSRYLDDLITSLIAWSTVYILQNFSSIRPTCRMPRPHFWIYIYLYQMVL